MGRQSFVDLKHRIESFKSRIIIEMLNIDYDDYNDKALELSIEELDNRNIKDYLVSDRNRLKNIKSDQSILFKELILQVRFDEVFKKLKKISYIEASTYEDYEKVFNELISMNASNENNIRISIEESDNIFNPSVKELNIFGQYIKEEEKFEMDYLTWKQWLACMVNTEEVFRIGKEAYVAYCLSIITKHGLTQGDVDQSFNKIKDNKGIIEAEANYEENLNGESKEIHPWRRYFARSIDYMIFQFFINFIWTLLPANINVILYRIARIIAITPIMWMFIEMILICKIGTTLGKWILNIKVQKKDGKLLSLGESFYRSFLVWSIGLGFGIEFIQVITKLVAYFRLQRRGETVWDYKVDSELEYGRVGLWRAFTTIFILLVIPMVIVVIQTH
ncbi:RDD family protein [Sporosalibacterium faouarense]|uniref:RDD family protein n=1 Tax=Sporosalibacterium faouarense TaxID=516123 RepID=UPI00192CDFFF|nr:RDD family protein [Sporosalibacterium faouarense]